MGAVDHDSPEALFALMLTLPAQVVVGHTPPVIEEEGQLQLPLSAPDTTPADELIREVRKAMQSTGDRVQEFLEIFCKAFQLKYKRLTDEERITLKRLFKRSPLIKNSGINFRRRPWK